MPIRWHGSPGISSRRPSRIAKEQPSGTSTVLVRARDLPRILPAQPVVGPLVLPAVLDRLREDAVLVAEPVAHRGQLQGGHRVEEAGRQAPEPAVAEPGVRLLLEQREPVEPLLLGNAGDVRVEQQVRRRCWRASARSGTPSTGSRRASGSRARRSSRSRSSAGRARRGPSARRPRSARAGRRRRRPRRRRRSRWRS